VQRAGESGTFKRMRTDKPQPVYREDYRIPDYWIDTVDLYFDLGAELTVVATKLQIRRNEAIAGDPAPLVLDGEELELHEIRIDGRDLNEREYFVEQDRLVIPNVPGSFELETVVTIRPQDNTELSGLYKSHGCFCTQCEAMGFRRITYFLDRPDVMATFSTTIVAPKSSCPVLLSNGNRVDGGELDAGLHWVRWQDPFPKPSYLFALVAGDLRCHAGEYVTRSGRPVRLEIWTEPQNADRCEHALRSLQNAMRWDEQVFSLEYDLDVYMIVAVSDFNMGAMENKGLNVFNSKYVLALPKTATDDDYESIEGVIGHEYFHNWTGNRVTCRDWFQLTLKEGLTVFRDQQFTADTTSAAFKRIHDVRTLRTAQFPEDAGPLSHPIRPESYISMDNFYTATVYEKGAEVVRMYHTLLGADGFRRGMDLYFERHDGQAVTCDDFRRAMADANGADLEQFERWYAQPGTPILEAAGRHDAARQTYTLELRQCAPERAEPDASWLPLHVPVAVGLLGSDGGDLPLQLEGETTSLGHTRVLELRDAAARFVFTGVEAPPVPSLLRGFSAPVRLRAERSRAELGFLASHDSDPFNRWDAGQTLAQDVLLELAADWSNARALSLDPLLEQAVRRLLEDEEMDGSLKSLALTLPSQRVLAQEMEVIDPDALHAAREFTLQELARRCQPALEQTYAECRTRGPYASDKTSIDRRRLKGAVLSYLASLGEKETRRLLVDELDRADNMTDAQAALSLLVDLPSREREQALERFYARWQHDPLVVDKWFSIQACSTAVDTCDRVLELAQHPDFTLRNPNRARALVGAFSMSNPVRFHGADGRGYAFLANQVLDLDALNPQVAARLVAAFNDWRRYDLERQKLIQTQLQRIAGHTGLSKDVTEIVLRALG
jgi:aminopeptidase N